MSKKWHFHACDIRVVCEQRCAVEHCLLWRDLDNPRTNCATMDDIFNALESRYDGWANVEWEDEFTLSPVCLSADGIELLRSEPYFVVNKETVDISEDDMYTMCAITGVDPVELARACDTDVEWRERIDDAICRAMLNHDYLIEFRTEEEAREYVIEDLQHVLRDSMREALEAVADGFSDGEIIDGVHIGATIEFAGKQYSAKSYPSDGKLNEGATGSEVDALCEDMIEDALNHIEANA